VSTSHMGNTPSVSGPERGGVHEEGDITVGGRITKQRPASYNAGDSGNELPDSHSILETNRKSHFEVITEQPNGASNRKLSNGNAPRPSYSYTHSKLVKLSWPHS